MNDPAFNILTSKVYHDIPTAKRGGGRNVRDYVILTRLRNQTCVALAVATFTEKPDGACHSFRSSLVVELTSLTELEVTCYIG